MKTVDDGSKAGQVRNSGLELQVKQSTSRSVESWEEFFGCRSIWRDMSRAGAQKQRHTCMTTRLLTQTHIHISSFSPCLTWKMRFSFVSVAHTIEHVDILAKGNRAWKCPTYSHHLRYLWLMPPTYRLMDPNATIALKGSFAVASGNLC